MERENTPWCHVPNETTADELLDRLWQATQATCSCGGAGPEEGCQVCQTWHYVTGATNIMVHNAAVSGGGTPYTPRACSVSGSGKGD